MDTMPYQYLTFSDLYEEEVRSSAPSSPVMGATASPSLSPVFLLPTAPAGSTYRHNHASSSHHHTASRSHSHSRRRADVHGHAMLQTLTQDSDDVAAPITGTSHSAAASASASSGSHSSSSLHLDFLKVFKRRTSLNKRHKDSHTGSDSAFSTPASSRRSSFTSHGFASLHPVSAASSANTSPAISRQVTKVSEYDALVQRTARQEHDEELQRQSELQAYFNQAAETGLSLRRF